MTKRKGLSKKLRFEVFKRDSFKCVYCGRSAPDVVLHVDHIVPASKGGTNEITNLVTACADCNLGKSDRTLDDQSTVMKQKRQLDELNERREQLEMIKQWNDELKNIKTEAIEYAADFFTSIAGYVPNNDGKRMLRRLIKKYGIQSVIDGITDSVEKNYRDTESSAELAFNRIESNILYKIREKTDPELNKILYIRGILRNRFQRELHPGELRYIVQTMRHVVDKGIMTVDKLKDEALTAEDLVEWYTAIDCCIAMHKKEMDEQNESQADS
jgi:hypothetical protein